MTKDVETSLNNNEKKKDLKMGIVVCVCVCVCVYVKCWSPLTISKLFFRLIGNFATYSVVQELPNAINQVS